MEPYGVGIEITTLSDFGAKPVQYGTATDFQEMPCEQRYLFQIQKSRDLVWDVEREWRIKGNLDLSTVPTESIIIVVPYCSEMEIIQSQFGYRSVAVETLRDDTVSQEKSPTRTRITEEFGSLVPKDEVS